MGSSLRDRPLSAARSLVRRAVNGSAATTEPELTRRLRAVEDELAGVQSDLRAVMRHLGVEVTVDRFLKAVRQRLAEPAPAGGDIQVVEPSGMILPADGPLQRTPPRRPEDQQPDYLARYDAHTLFYDVFRCRDDIWLSGPPLHDLAEVVRTGRWTLDGTDVSDRIRLRDWSRTQRSRLRAPGAGADLELELTPMEGGPIRFGSRVGADDAARFAGHRALISKSKDNDLVWIQDWLRFYHDVHGVTAVVLYDNNSTRYTPADIAAAIAEVPGIEVGAVVAWNYPWGAPGGPKKIWDSDYLQYSLMEHGRFRFLRDAAGVINADIDELAIADDGRTVFEHAEDSLAGAVRYDGVWIAKATRRPLDPERQRRFVDYRHQRPGMTTVKWAVIPGRLDERTSQWRIHSIVGSSAEKNGAITHRHFQGVNNSWKYDRAETVTDPERHTLDVKLNLILDLVFGDQRR